MIIPKPQFDRYMALFIGFLAGTKATKFSQIWFFLLVVLALDIILYRTWKYFDEKREVEKIISNIK